MQSSFIASYSMGFPAKRWRHEDCRQCLAQVSVLRYPVGRGGWYIRTGTR
jgi:hypothetical protein